MTVTLDGMSCSQDRSPHERIGELHPIDVYVGQRLREGRLSRGLSESALARQVGVTFQQVQKYELGTARMSASILWAFADLLGVQPNWFYEGLNGLSSNKVSVANDHSPRTTGGIETTLLASDLTAEEHAAALAVIRWLRSRPMTEFH